MSTHRGKLIVFEGLDRSGKSTQCIKLADSLRQAGRQVLNMRFPNRTTPIGQMINSYLHGDTQQEDHVIHLLFSANRWESAGEIEAAIARGHDVVIDRYYYSGAVYSAAKNNANMTLEWCRKPDEGLPRPDVCLFLDVSSEVAAQRGGFGTERYENREMQARVRELFQEMRGRVDEGVDIVVIDAGREMEAVEEEVRSVVDRASARVDAEGTPLRRVAAW